MKRIAQWSLIFVMIALVGFGATVLAARGAQMAFEFNDSASINEVAVPEETFASAGTLSSSQAETLAASAASPSALAEQLAQSEEELSAVGAIEVKEDRNVVLGTGGRVEDVLVEDGDVVKAGDPLAQLDTTYLDWAVEQAEIGFETARIDFEKLGDLIEESDIELARAQLLQAQEDLAEVEDGPSTEEMAAAQSAATAAWAQYEETKNIPLPPQVNMALANLRKSEISLEQAQREFDKIAWLPEAAATDAADNLQRATVDLEAAKASHEEASKPATEAQLQSALSGAHSAQDRLNDLLKMPTPAQLAAAKAAELASETALNKLEKGPEESELRKAELNVRQAMIGLEQARLEQSYAKVTAPIDGVVLAINLNVGQEASSGSVAATLADTTDLRLIVNVEQKDIGKVTTGLPVTVSVFALPDETFTGEVDRIAPTANSGTGFVTFPVIIILSDGPMDQLLPGMTASAVFSKPAQSSVEEDASEEDASETDADTVADAEPEEDAAADTDAQTSTND